MLRNLVYLGHIVQGKTTKVSFKSRLTLQNPKDEWVVVKNMHEPLISQEIFDHVRRRCVSRRNEPKTAFENIFSGIAKCADCRRNMSTTGTRRKGSVYNLVCGGYKLYGSRECSNHFIDYDILYRIVLQEIQTLLSMTGEDKKEILAALEQTSSRDEKPAENGIATALRKREEELDRIIQRLYEDSFAGRLDEKRFYKMLSAFEAEQTDISARLVSLAKLENPKQVPAEQEACRKFFSLLEEVTKVTELTPDLLHKLIDKIEICQGSFEKGRRGGHKHQAIRIYYKFIGQLEPADEIIIA